MDSEDNINHLRVASFSAYLNTPEDNFVLKLAGVIQESSPAIISPEETPSPISSGRSKTTKEGEISIFGADKYFNMRMDYGTPGITDNKERKHWHKKEDCNDLHHLKPRFRSGTPSATSEASSWNSQTALLPSLAKSSSQMKQKRALGRRFFLGFGCTGPCMDKKSVISESAEPVTYTEAKQSHLGSKRGEHFAFPILNPVMENLGVKMQSEEEKLAEARKSLEVFGSSMTKKGDIAVNLERKLSMLTWDAIPKTPSLPTTLGSGGVCDDMASDASSDLFEIENISGTGQYSLLTRQASDNMSGCMTPTTLYEPSEASIEWSVITASAADVSVLSDYDEKNIINAGGMSRTSTTSKTAKTKSIVRPSGLLGCRTHKAVSVAETAYKANGKANPM